MADLPGQWKRRHLRNVDRIKSGRLDQVRLVVDELEERERTKGLSAGERRMLHPALGLRDALIEGRPLPPAGALQVIRDDPPDRPQP